jgi:hypothetical protein
VLSYYIYYRVARPGDAELKLGRLQSAIRDALGVQGRVLRKRSEAALWMEIYERVPDAAAFEQLMDRLVTETGFDACLQSGSRRTVECFEEA